MESTEDKVRRLLAGQFGIEPARITNDADLVNDLGLDSLDTVEVAMMLEEEFGIAIPDEKMEKAKTFGNLITIINEASHAEA